MKSAKVLKILHISRQTLVKYVQNKEIRVVELPNGFYDYNDDDVYRKAGLANERLNVTYARVSTVKQKADLANQEQTLVSYCNKNGIKVNKSYKDVASGMNFDRKQFKLPSNPQPMGFRGNLLVKRQKFFYCTYSLGITETS